MELVLGSFIYDSAEAYETFARRLVQHHIANIRLNCANFGTERIVRHVKMLRTAFADRAYPVKLFLDVPYPGEKVRANSPRGGFSFVKGEVYTLSREVAHVDTDICIRDEAFFQSLAVGDDIYLDDGKYSFVVTAIQQSIVHIVAKQGGHALNNKAIYTENCQFRKKSLSDNALAEQLSELLSTTRPEYMIMSFCEDVSEILSLKALLNELGLDTVLIPKVETRAGFLAHRSFFPYVDTLMLGRGDMGSTRQGINALGKIQNELIDSCHASQKSVMVATDILSSLQEARIFPSRAEVLDLYYLLQKSVDYIFASAQIADSDSALAAFCNLCRHMEV